MANSAHVVLFSLVSACFITLYVPYVGAILQHLLGELTLDSATRLSSGLDIFCARLSAGVGFDCDITCLNVRRKPAEDCGLVPV